MEYEIKTIACKVCGKHAVVGIMSIDSSHQCIEELICPACMTDEHISRVGTQHLDPQNQREPEHSESGSGHSSGDLAHG